MNELYASKTNRDVRYKELKKAGYPVSRSNVRNQCLHPMYVEDQKQNLSQEDKGFGNIIYKTFWPVLYKVEWEMY